MQARRTWPGGQQHTKHMGGPALVLMMATESQYNNVVYSPSNIIITATTSVYTCKGPNAIELEKEEL